MTSPSINATDSLAFYDTLYRDSLYRNDPYAIEAAKSYNANFRAEEKSDSADTTVQSTGNSSSTSGQGNSAGAAASALVASSSSGWVPYAVSGVAIVGGVAALIYAGKKGDGSVLKGLGNIWNSWFKKEGKSAVESASGEISDKLRRAISNAQGFTARKGGTQIIFRNGKPVRIIEDSRSSITDPKKVEKWISKNPEAEKEVLKYVTDNIPEATACPGQKLPDGVTMSWFRNFEIKGNNYMFIVENGQVSRVLKEKGGEYKDLVGNELSGFIKNHVKEVKQAESLEKTVSLKDLRLPKGKKNKPTLIKPKGESTDVKIKVRNGKVIEASYKDDTGNEVQLIGQQLRLIEKDFAKEIKKFGKEFGETYRLGDGEALNTALYSRNFEINGAKVKIRFDRNGNIESIDSIINKPKVIGNNKNPEKAKEAIDKYLEDNPEIKAEVEALAEGRIPEGFVIPETIVRSEGGYIFKISGEKVVEVELKDGKKLTGKNLKDWMNDIDNQAEVDKISGLLKD